MDAIISFKTAQQAILAERLLLDAGEAVRVMPLPGSIAAGCGICLRLPPARRLTAAGILRAGGVRAQGVHVDVGGGYKPFPEPIFSSALGIGPDDAVAVVGCGGKTALANRLAAENRHLPVLFSTTTRIIMPAGGIVDHRLTPGADAEALAPGVNLACEPATDGKLCGFAADDLARLRPPGGLIVIEADGSRGLPLKGWAEYEPVIPSFTTVTVGVCVLWPLGRAFSKEIAHRPELFRKTAAIADGENVAIAHLAAMIGEMFRKAVGKKILYINQVETPEREQQAALLAERLGDLRVVAGSVRESRIVLPAGER